MVADQFNGRMVAHCSVETETREKTISRKGTISKARCTSVGKYLNRLDLFRSNNEAHIMLRPHLSSD